MSVFWYFTAYSTATDRLTWYEPLKDVSLKLVQRLWGRPPDDPMVACYPVTPAIASDLRNFVTRPLDFDHFAYFVEGSSDPDWSGL